MYLKIVPSANKNKRFTAILFDQNKKQDSKYDFGAKRRSRPAKQLKEGSTYIDHKDSIKKENYIKRHKALNTENWNEINPGSLSRYILWEYTDLDKAIKEYAKRFNLKLI